MPELYNEWWQRGCDFHYVSNSPWELLPAINRFFIENMFPSGSLHLRNFNLLYLDPIKNKRAAIQDLFRNLPDRKFIFVGDSGEKDLEMYTILHANLRYTALAKEYPGRVLRIYIRDVTKPKIIQSIEGIAREAPTSGSEKQRLFSKPFSRRAKAAFSNSELFSGLFTDPRDLLADSLSLMGLAHTNL